MKDQIDRSDACIVAEVYEPTEADLVLELPNVPTKERSMKDANGVELRPGWYVVMKNAPGPHGEFVELETETGSGALTGDAVLWREREDGFWVLGPFGHAAEVCCFDCGRPLSEPGVPAICAAAHYAHD